MNNCIEKKIHSKKKVYLYHKLVPSPGPDKSQNYPNSATPYMRVSACDVKPQYTISDFEGCQVYSACTATSFAWADSTRWADFPLRMSQK